jgi:glutathione synthase/RimK-type ligase-like ATP-grasp enzyme
VHSELHHALGAAWQMMTCLWMNHPNSVQLASYKFEQLSRARSFNFATPDTVVTNSVEAARAFVERHGGTCVYKLLTASAVAMYTRPEKTGMVSRGFSCPTTIVSARELSARGSLGGAPCQFQELIDKRREFRVTVIGDQVFAVRLELREPSRSEPDWRRLWTRETTKVVTLPSAVSDGCRAIAGSYGLTFAAIDLVESQDGTLFFLELNPIGQYLYLEGLHPELPLCDATIDVLLREAP